MKDAFWDLILFESLCLRLFACRREHTQEAKLNPNLGLAKALELSIYDSSEKLLLHNLQIRDLSLHLSTQVVCPSS
jgi:hypothetical protein